MPGFFFHDFAPCYFHDLSDLGLDETQAMGRSPQSDIYLPDPHVSREHATIRKTARGYLLHDRSRNGTKINHQNVKHHLLKEGDLIEIGRFHLAFHNQCPVPPPEHTQGMQETKILGNSPNLRKVLRQCRLAAMTDLPVIIFGETGTGKDMIAHYIHEQSRRSEESLLTLNCGALSATLMESELFGHEKGSFTGAFQARKGLLEVASQGTLFMDEIGELPLSLQPKLLRVLEAMKIRPLGANQDIPIQTRLITATHRDLTQEVQSGNFREDLFHRLHVFSLAIPPLRQRKKDIPLLAEDLLQKAGFAKQLSANALARLQEYSWPGNIREMRNVLLKAAVLTKGHQLEEGDLDIPLPDNSSPLDKNSPSILRTLNRGQLQENEMQLIQKTLQQNHWNRLKTASALGISRSTLYLKIRKYGF
jgi:DNA-binding NtrC family response regulator